MTYPPTLGVVLAGGHASRMGGTDKVRIRIGGTTILDRVLSRLRPQCVGIILNANGDAARFADTGMPVVADGMPDYPGPLAGILAGLDWAAANTPKIAWIVTVPGDSPFLPRDLLPRLQAARQQADAALACAVSAGEQHPVVALWPVALRDDLRRALADGTRRVRAWSARYAQSFAEWPAEPVDPFFNVNTPAQAAEAERLAAQYPTA